MQRGNKVRTICIQPQCTRFVAEGADPDAGTMTITLDMLEAMRLVDTENLAQQQAARQMNVSTPTLCRILAEGRRRTALALLNGTTILLEGGNIMYTNASTMSSAQCQGRHGQNMGQGRGQRRGQCGSAAGSACQPGQGMGQGRGMGRGQGRGMGQGRGQGRGMGQGMGRGQGMGGQCGMGQGSRTAPAEPAPAEPALVVVDTTSRPGTGA